MIAPRVLRQGKSAVFVGVELKRSYYEQAAENLRRAENTQESGLLAFAKADDAD